jgi:hypothetical protein
MAGWEHECGLLASPVVRHSVKERPLPVHGLTGPWLQPPRPLAVLAGSEVIVVPLHPAPWCLL